MSIAGPWSGVKNRLNMSVSDHFRKIIIHQSALYRQHTNTIFFQNGTIISVNLNLALTHYMLTCGSDVQHVLLYFSQLTVSQFN